MLPVHRSFEAFTLEPIHLIQLHTFSFPQAAVNSIVDGLVSALVTLGVVPIIRCPRGGAAEHVASVLEGRLRDLLKGRSNLFSEASAGPGSLAATLSRPLLVLFDRNFDLAVMLQHAWSYKPLVQVRVAGKVLHACVEMGRCGWVCVRVGAACGGG